MTTEAQRRETRLRLFNDFEFWAEHACKIRTKEGDIKPLVLNAVQKRFVKQVNELMATTGLVRLIVLKARQQGLSTIIHAWMYWWLSQHKAQKGIVVAHEAKSTQALLAMYQRTHDQMPPLLKPQTSYHSRKELVFPKLDTGLMVSTAGGDAIARGETLTQAHRSEVAFWPPAHAANNMNALDQSIPNTPGTADFIESTANGYNQFYELWKGAVEGTNGYTPFFSPWFETPEYREAPPSHFERTLEEQDLVEKYDLDDAQLYWRRLKIGRNGRELFMQEYPATPEEAFIASGRPVFNPEQLTLMSQNASGPGKRMAAEEVANTLVFREHPAGELFVYHELDPAETYYIGADVGMGVRGGDFSVAQVLDSQMRQVSVWRGLVHPDYFARILAAMGLYYNTALVAPERNAHGILTCVRLWKDLSYPNVFFDLSEGQIADRETPNIGFQTNARTKPLIIDRLRAALREDEIQVNDKTTIEEMRTYIVTESGAMEAEKGCHDDAVMSLAIASHIHCGKFKPVVFGDEHYVRAI